MTRWLKWEKVEKCSGNKRNKNDGIVFVTGQWLNIFKMTGDVTGR